MIRNVLLAIKTTILATLFALVFTGCAQLQSPATATGVVGKNVTTSPPPGIVYEYKLRTIFCQTCEKGEGGLSETQLKVIRDEVLKEIDDESILFDSFAANSIHFIATREGKERLHDIGIESGTLKTSYTEPYLDDVTQRSAENTDDDEVYACEYDTDCIVQTTECCYCAGDGTEVSINKSFKEFWRDSKAEKCSGIMCPQGCPSTSFADDPLKAVCVIGRCALQ
jgi:hypothetical protein